MRVPFHLLAAAETLAAAMDRLAAPLRPQATGNATGPAAGAAGAAWPQLPAGAGAAAGGADGGGGGGAGLPGLPLLEGLCGPDDMADLFLRPGVNST